MKHYLADGRLMSVNKQPKYRFDCDVLTIGSSDAGCTAAIDSAKCGYSVICTDSGKAPFVNNEFGEIGLCGANTAEEIEKMSVAHGNFMSAELDGKKCVNVSAKMLAGFEAMKKYGVLFAADCAPFAVFTEKGRITGAEFITPDGLCDISARAVIDTTGIIARLCGCETLECDNKLPQKLSYVIECGGVLKTMHSRNFNLPNDRFVRSKAIVGEYANMSLDGKIKTVSTSFCGSECRRIRTKKTVDCKSIFRKTDNAAFVGIANFDSLIESTDTDFLQNWLNIAELKNYGVGYAVPKKAMTVREANNLIVAGGAMGLSVDIAAAMQKRDMELSGAAAAVIADEMLDNKCVGEQIDFDGARLYDSEENEVKLPESYDEFSKILTSEYPNAAYFAVISDVDARLTKQLKADLESDNELLKNRCAIALGMLGDNSAAKILGEMAGRCSFDDGDFCEIAADCEKAKRLLERIS